ncbi:BolA family protein [Lyngbya confervoides]|uniref:BolA family transcriptional regulator n=1 Tax=Lyngbya confervoides BDU141951 TaxID=1574623 RepID=A0ABD4T8E4_9CYAN|nr:BolA family transcriptional regulator [Lyngbya confervoides]MCM1984743.1 BolA family transcriptional regulator [Lyngbya confervoides BDU141951]
MINPEQLTTMIREGIPDAQVTVEDLTGGGDHYQATVISESFNGKTLVQQHQMVYRAVNAIMADETLHALALKTFTPEKWTTQA